MSLIDDLKQWKTDLEDLGIEKGRAEGRLEQAMADLKKLGFDTVEQAAADLEQKKVEKQDAEEKAQVLLEALKEKYKAHIV